MLSRLLLMLLLHLLLLRRQAAAPGAARRRRRRRTRENSKLYSACRCGGRSTARHGIIHWRELSWALRLLKPLLQLHWQGGRRSKRAAYRAGSVRVCQYVLNPLLRRA